MFLRAQVWSDAGWTAVERVIRHKAGKPMVRVLTHTGLVDVTTDHSLLRADGSPATPREVNIGDALLHTDFPEFPLCPSAITCLARARVMGFFFGDGSAGIYRSNGNTQRQWKLSNSDLDMLERYKGLCEIAFPDNTFVIYDTMKSSAVYSLTLLGARDMAEEYCNTMYSADRNKVVPPSILGASENIRRAFWEGMHDSDGDKEVGLTRIDQKSQWSAATIAILAASLGYNVSLNTRSDKLQIYRVTATMQIQRRRAHAIKKIQDLPVDPDAYVYDLTTANHHFAAGVGRLVVHNTDSTMCIFNLGDDKRHDVAAHFEVAERVAKEISQTFPSPVELEFEKVYFPYLLFSKKRYAGNMYISPDAPSYIDVKGLQLVRRDNAPIVKEVSKSILDAIMIHKSRQKATDVAREFLERVLDDEFPIEQYIVSKSLRTGYKNDAQPHVHVSRKILQRTGQPVPSGSRVPYVFVEDLKNPDALQALKAEDPEYAAQNHMKLDYLYYIDHQLTTPITSLLEILGVDVTKEIFQHISIERRIENLRSNVSDAIKVAKRIRKNTKNNQQEITRFFQA